MKSLFFVAVLLISLSACMKVKDQDQNKKSAPYTGQEEEPNNPESNTHAETKPPVPTPSAPTPSAPTPSAPTPPVPTPSAPTPSAPTPSAPTPSAPTPSAPTPSAPTPSAPTPSAPTPSAPTPSAPTPPAPKPPAPKPPVVPDTKIENKVLSIRVEALPEPYKYQAKIFVEHATEPLLIRKTETQTSQSWILKYQPNLTLIDNVVSGKSYLYELLNPSHVTEVFDKLKISVPQDFVLIGDPKKLVLVDAKIKQAFEKSKRIFLSNMGLVTNGIDFIIQTDELVAENTTIFTFPDGAKANENRIGRPGGRITISAKKARGSLRVELRGENGGDGSMGKNQPPGTAGANGKAYSAEEHTINKKFLVCKVMQNPKEGGDGLPGGDGLDGQPGGSTGSLSINIGEEEGFDFRVDRFQGIGGSGGLGGRGGAGGPGGKYEPKYIEGLCESKNAAPGKKGVDGLKGRDAHPGAAERVCVKRAWDQTVNCY